MRTTRPGRILGPLLISILVLGCTRLSEEALLKKSEALHHAVLTVDTHTDTPLSMMRGYDMGVRHQPGARGRGKYDIPRMIEGGLDAAFFAVFVGQEDCNPEEYARARQRADELLDLIEEMAARHPDRIELATSPEDAYRIERAGKRAIYTGLENGFPIGKDLDRISRYYERGIRYITLCHTRNNDICDSSGDEEGPRWNGLSPFGEAVVAEMNRLGIIVDVSHLSDESVWDILKITKAPIIASHSSTRALFDHERNLSDDQLRALAENGGVIQISLISFYMKRPGPERRAALDSLEEKYGSYYRLKDPVKKAEYEAAWMKVQDRFASDRATVQDVVDHIDHAVRVAGIDHVGIGTDFDGGGGVLGCDDVSEFPNLTTELLRRGYSEEEIRKIWGGNFMRVFRKVVEVSGRTTPAS